MISEFEENNPLSQLAFILLRNEKVLTLKVFDESTDKLKKKISEIVTQYSDSQEFNLHNTLQMKTIGQDEPLGRISLLKGLNKCRELFLNSPMYYYKEVYTILSSSNTKDKSDIFVALDYFTKYKIRISILSLNCSLYLYEKIAETCDGKIVVPTNKEELEDYIFDIAEPLFIQTDSSLNCNFSVSFPGLEILKGPILCMCHDEIM